MSILSFQQALSDLVASPNLCLLMLHDAESVLSRYELSPREKWRLTEVVSQHGMVVNCSLYRANRLALLYNRMPHTCFLLGDDLPGEAELFWESFKETTLQYAPEIEQFGKFLQGRIREGHLTDQLVQDVFAYELLMNELRSLPHKQIMETLSQSRACSANDQLALHPFIRVTLFRYDPEPLLKLLTERRPPPYTITEGEFWLLLSTNGEALNVKQVSPELGRLLKAIEEQHDAAPFPLDDIEELIEADLLTRRPSPPSIQMQSQESQLSTHARP